MYTFYKQNHKLYNFVFPKQIIKFFEIICNLSNYQNICLFNGHILQKLLINQKMSTLSPSRKFYSNYLTRKQSYTQNRQQNINQTNLSQYSPSIRSPKLNEQSEYTKLNNAGHIQQLKIKLQTVLKHNSHLLNQNATLSQMVNNLKMELQIRLRREETQTVKMSAEYTTIIEELKQNIKFKQAEVIRLMDQISRLHDQSYRIQLTKNNQIKDITQAHEKQLTTQIRNIKKSADDSKQILQLQVKKLRQTVQLKNYEYEALKSLTKGQTDKLRSQIQQLRNQTKHFNQLKQIEIRELNEKYKQMLNVTSKSSQRQNDLMISKLQSKIRKLKQDVINKNLQIQQTSKKMAMNSQEHQLQIQNLNNQRQRLLSQINDLQLGGKANYQKEKDKLRNLGQLQLKNLQNIAQNQRDCLKSQINKLLIVCASKTDQIKKLYTNIAEIKETHAAEKRDNERLIQTLRKRIKTLEQDNMQQLQLLKVKMAQLHQADVQGLQRYYQNEVALLSKQIKQLQEHGGSDRQKIHHLLQQNDLLRKNFETELTKYKAKVQDYKVKFAAANLQFREQITSLGTKMQLTSQTLLRQTQQKQKGAQFFQAQKKKFHLLILGKDKQIAAAHQSVAQLKQLHSQEIKQLRTQITNLRQNLNSKIAEIKDMRRQFQQQFERKSQKLIDEKHQNPNETLIVQNKQLRSKVDILEKQLFAKVKQIQFIQRQVKSLQQEVGLRAGFLQTMQLQSSAAIQDQRSKLKILMNQNEVAMKDYYQTKLQSKDKDIAGLQAQLHQKQNDIRQLIIKYNQLQKRLKQLLESQQKLSQFEKKIMNLGLDQNLVKNMGQLFARYRK